MLAYERASWTDEHLNAAPSKDNFELPDVEGGHARWRWVNGSVWHVDGVPSDGDEAQGWIYYDNKWRDGRRGQDGWGRYTRRRKWLRDAELVEVTASTEVTPSPTPYLSPMKPSGGDSNVSDSGSTATLVDNNIIPTPSEEDHMLSPQASHDDDPADYASSQGNDDGSGKVRRRRWFRRDSRATSVKSTGTSATGGTESSERRYENEDVHSPLDRQNEERANPWDLNDDARMQFG